MQDNPKVRTCLWFDGDGEEAAELYVSLLPDSVIEKASRPEPGKPALIVELSLAGTPYMFLNGGPHYKLSPAASIVVRTADQSETDRLWDALLADGGEESRCALNAEIEIEGTRLMLADEMPDVGSTSPTTLEGTSVVLDLHVADADAVFEKALEAGAEEVYPLDDQFYGDRAGRVRDPFGHYWIIATRLREVSVEEMVAAFQSMFGAEST